MATEDTQDTLSLTLRLATHPVHPAPSDHPLTLPRGSTVLDLKNRLHDDWDGRPRQEGVTVVKGGRVLRDSEVLEEVFDEELKTSPTPSLVLHIIVRPTAWSQPFSTRPPPPSPVPSISPPRSASPASANADDLMATPLPSPGLAAPEPVPIIAEDGAAQDGAEQAQQAMSPTPTVCEIPPTPVPTPPQQPGYSPAYLSPSSALPSSSSASPAAANQQPREPREHSRYLQYLAHLQKLIPLQRALLLLNLQKAHGHYQALVSSLSYSLADLSSGTEREEKDGEGELREVEELLRGCGLWSAVEEAEKMAQAEYEEMVVKAEQGGGRGGEEFQVVQLGDLPYLLHTPPALLVPPALPPLAALLRLRRAQSTLSTLTTLLQLLITFQPSLPAVAYGRASPAAGGGANPLGAVAGQGVRQGYRPFGGGAAAVAGGDAQAQQQQLAQAFALAGLAPPPVPPAPLAAAAAAGAAGGRRPATLNILINLEAVFALVLPLLFLTLKLAFLLWIFGRHASPTKRVILGVAAVAWVVWEGWGIQRRRAQVGRERERQERERRRAARAARGAAQAQQAQQQGQAFVLPGAGAGAAPPPPAAAPPGQAQPAAPPAPAPAPARPRARPTRRSPPPSRLSPKYWLNTLAAVGLVAEARELGLQPRFIAGRPIPPPVPRELSPQGRRREELRRRMRNVWVGVVLFFGTLSPEVERKRKRALEKRERLLAERRAVGERERALAAVATARSAVAGGVQRREEEGEGALTPQQRETEEGDGLPWASPPRAASSSSPVEPIGDAGAEASASTSTATACASEEGAASGLRRRLGAATSAAAAEARQAGSSAAASTSGAGEGKNGAGAEGKEEEKAEGEKRGRRKVADEELFRDGGSEAYQPAASSSSSPALPAEAASRPAADEQQHQPLPPAEPVPVPDLLDPLDLDGEGDSASASSSAASVDGDAGNDAEQGAAEGGQEGEGEVERVAGLF